MKNRLEVTTLLVLLSFVVMLGCKDDEPEPASLSYGILQNYMLANNLDLPDLLNNWEIEAIPISEPGGIVDTENYFTIPDYIVFDIRNNEEYGVGHISGAIQVDLENVVSMASNFSEKPFLIVSATGQAAGHAVMALRLSGYSDAKVLKWGMSGWNDEYACLWNNNAGSENGNIADGNPNWSNSDAPPLEAKPYPDWASDSKNGAAILAERVTAMLKAGSKSINSSDVLDNPAAYQIINLWPTDIYKSIGHFTGALQMEAISIVNGSLKTLNPGTESLLYGYTGHASSMAVAWLNVLGFDAKNILYGVNGLKYDALVNLNNPEIIWNGSHGYESQKPDQFNNFRSYLINNEMDLPDILNSWITSAAIVYDVNNDSDPDNDYFIIDIRQEDDYNNGHIEGAQNIYFPNVLAAAANANEHPIVVTCYTGQTSGFAVVALRLSGYPNAQVLKWGMSSWNAATAEPWMSNVGDAADGDPNWAAAPGEISANILHVAPQLNYQTNNMQEILENRVWILLNGGFKGLPNVDVLANPYLYFINNFWNVTDVEQYGNIKTSYRIQPLTLGDGEYAYLDGTVKVVTYCWTGQTSSMITAYLNILGYDAYCLKYGANGMIYSYLESHKYSESQIMDYPLTSGN